MNSISLNGFQRYHSYQALYDLAPFLVTGQRGLRMRVTGCFDFMPGITRMTLTKVRELSTTGWNNLLECGPVVITVYGSPWFMVELAE